MNERIKELAEQANKQIRHRICPNTFKPIDDPNGPHIRIEFDKEKFAELIVQEAAAFVSGAAEVHNQAEQDACVRASKGLKKYFGVKE